MDRFDHEKLDVYKAAIALIVLAEKMIDRFPRKKNHLIDQLQRASSSVVLNIAEGAGEYSINEKCRFYRIAKRSATECAGIIDVCRTLNLVDKIEYEEIRKVLLRIVSMLTKMAQATDKSHKYDRIAYNLP